MVLVGYCPTVPMNYSPIMKRIVISMDVVVDKTSTCDSKEDHSQTSL
ncbi:hypothetical protein A2U01_0028945, partial [Trifolium medium]|nr:hypothetical protein [Trifolium medium]